MSQFNAARRLLMDSVLAQKLEDELDSIINDGGFDPVDALIDEVQDVE